jgi:hypothetical protein
VAIILKSELIELACIDSKCPISKYHLARVQGRHLVRRSHDPRFIEARLPPQGRANVVQLLAAPTNALNRTIAFTMNGLWS